jgi:predicted RNase H-like HicB family nuclease
MPLRYYPALIQQDEGGTPADGYGVVFPDLPGCTSGGSSVQKAATNAAEALGMYIEGLIEDDGTVPEASAPDAPLPDWLKYVPGHVVATILVPADVPGRTVRANVTFDAALVARVDRAAAGAGITRSAFLAQAAKERLARTGTTRRSRIQSRMGRPSWWAASLT